VRQKVPGYTEPGRRGSTVNKIQRQVEQTGVEIDIRLKMRFKMACESRRKQQVPLLFL